MSKDNLKASIIEVVTEIFNVTNNPITGAVLAEQLRKRGADYKEAGYQKLAEPINELVEFGMLSRNRSVKHLEVAPSTFEFEAVIPKTKTSIDSYIREDAWPAFAMLNSSSIAVFDREEQKFRLLGREASLKETQIRVDTPSSDEHRKWVKQFAAEHELSIDSIETESATVLRDFSIWMQSQASPLQYEWKSFRASKVAEAIRKWSADNEVDPSVFLSRVIPGYTARASSTQCERFKDVRTTILQCISELSMDDLEDIKLPLRVVLKHFKPRD